MDKRLNILIACEESQAICNELRGMGHEAYSCDIQECSGGHPEWHIHQDVLPILNGCCDFTTQDGESHHIGKKWDMIIAHPPCTYLTVSGAWCYDVNRFGEKAIRRMKLREEAEDFFMAFANADCEHIAIENPVGTMSSKWRKPDQIIQPWYFGDPYMKTTCLWTKNLPKLVQTHFEKPVIEYKEWIDKNGKKKRQDMASFKCAGMSREERQRQRSKTFPGIAKAIAEQWSEYLLAEKTNAQQP